MNIVDRWITTFSIAPTFLRNFREKPWEDTTTFKEAVEYINQELKIKNLNLRLYRPLNQLSVGAFAWAWSKNSVGAIIDKKYEESPTARDEIKRSLVSARIDLNDSGYYVAEMATDQQYRGQGLASNSIKTFISVAEKQRRTLVLRTLKNREISEMAKLCDRFGLEDLRVNDLKDDRRTIFVLRSR
ncbi:MAG: hypothetical protein AAB838_03685 [Patescibacteria group bacterium]